MNITNLFTDYITITKIQERLPELFQIAELESSRAGKIGMEVGSVREKILIALLIYKFGKENVETEIPITEAEIDVKVFGEPISIKTMTGKKPGKVKISWTVDAETAHKFGEHYLPSCDMLFVQINWGGEGAMYLFSKKSQLEILTEMSRDKYIVLPKANTNPRGVEISSAAVRKLITHPSSLEIKIHWEHKEIDFDLYDRWLELWLKE